MERYLNGLAAVITIGTFAFSLLSSQALDFQEGAWVLGSLNLASRLLVFLLFQTCLAYAFSFPLHHTESLAQPFRVVAQVALLAVSAWVSLFNVIGILFNGLPTDTNSVGLAFWLYVAVAMFAGWLWSANGNHLRRHRRRFRPPHDHNPLGAIMAHVGMSAAFWVVVVARPEMFIH